jgi:hypothetical protein
VDRKHPEKLLSLALELHIMRHSLIHYKRHIFIPENILVCFVVIILPSYMDLKIHDHIYNGLFLYVILSRMIIKPTRCTNFSNLILEWNSICFGQFLCPLSGVFHCTHNSGICHTGYAHILQAGSGWNILILLAICQQTCMTCTISVCTLKNSWWWAEELSETCRVLFQNQIWKISASSWYIIRNLSRCAVTWTSNNIHSYNLFKAL